LERDAGIKELQMSSIPEPHPDRNGADRPKSGWRKWLHVHPAAELFPLMSETDPDGFKGMADDIGANGLNERVRVAVDDGGNLVLIDGRNRLDAL
jgi:hypothetical protein